MGDYNNTVGSKPNIRIKNKLCLEYHFWWALTFGLFAHFSSKSFLALSKKSWTEKEKNKNY